MWFRTRLVLRDVFAGRGDRFDVQIDTGTGLRPFVTIWQGPHPRDVNQNVVIVEAVAVAEPPPSVRELLEAEVEEMTLDVSVQRQLLPVSQ